MWGLEGTAEPSPGLTAKRRRRLRALGADSAEKREN